MIRPSTSATILCVAFLLTFGAFCPPLGAATSEPSAQPQIAVGLIATPEDAPELEPAPVPLSRAVYEVDVYGGMAVGTLVLEFAGDDESDLTAVYGCSIPDEVDVIRLETESYGRLRDLVFEADSSAQPAGKRNKGNGRGNASTKRSGKPAAAERFHRFHSESFALPSDEQTSVRTGFRMPVPLEGRTFTLTLPSVQDATREAAAVPLKIVVTVHHDAPLPVAQSRTHSVLVDYAGNRSIIETTEAEVPGDRLFELQFALNEEDTPTAAGYLRQDDDGRNGVEALLLPPEAPVEQTVRPKQILFLVDSSGSMSHEKKMVQARRAVSSCVDKLRPEDRFNIMEFDNDFTTMSPAPVEPNSQGKQNVAHWLEQVKADGGTKLFPALAAALEQPEDPERHRMLVVVTDGILSDREAALALLEEKLGDRRLFVVGTGRQHSQETLLHLAEYGRGAAAFAGDSDSLEAAVTELFDSIADPLGWDLRLELDGAVADEIVPSRLPDLYSGRPVRVLAWYDGDQPTSMRLRMSTVDGERLFNVKLPPPVR